MIVYAPNLLRDTLWYYLLITAGHEAFGYNAIGPFVVSPLGSVLRLVLVDILVVIEIGALLSLARWAWLLGFVGNAVLLLNATLVAVTGAAFGAAQANNVELNAAQLDCYITMFLVVLCWRLFRRRALLRACTGGSSGHAAEQGIRGTGHSGDTNHQ